jgi:hypothetical protein
MSKAIKVWVGLSATKTMRTFDKYIFSLIPPMALYITKTDGMYKDIYGYNRGRSQGGARGCTCTP